MTIMKINSLLCRWSHCFLNKSFMDRVWGDRSACTGRWPCWPWAFSWFLWCDRGTRMKNRRDAHFQVSPPAMMFRHNNVPSQWIFFTDDTLSMDQRLLKLILQNHILKVKVGLNDLYNGQILETIGGKQLRVFVYRTVSELDQGLLPLYTGLSVTWHVLVQESQEMFLKLL